MIFIDQGEEGGWQDVFFFFPEGAFCLRGVLARGEFCRRGFCPEGGFVLFPNSYCRIDIDEAKVVLALQQKSKINIE